MNNNSRNGNAARNGNTARNGNAALPQRQRNHNVRRNVMRNTTRLRRGNDRITRRLRGQNIEDILSRINPRRNRIGSTSVEGEVYKISDRINGQTKQLALKVMPVTLTYKDDRRFVTLEKNRHEMTLARSASQRFPDNVPFVYYINSDETIFDHLDGCTGNVIECFEAKRNSGVNSTNPVLVLLENSVYYGIYKDIMNTSPFPDRHIEKLKQKIDVHPDSQYSEGIFNKVMGKYISKYSNRGVHTWVNVMISELAWGDLDSVITDERLRMPNGINRSPYNLNVLRNDLMWWKDIYKQIITGIFRLLSIDINHNDTHPGNILLTLTQDTNNGEPKWLALIHDFGRAKIIRNRRNRGIYKYDFRNFFQEMDSYTKCSRSKLSDTTVAALSHIKEHMDRYFEQLEIGNLSDPTGLQQMITSTNLELDRAFGGGGAARGGSKTVNKKSKTVYIKGVGKRVVKHFKNGNKYVIVNGKKKRL